FKGGKTVPRPPKPTTRVFAMPERTKQCEITFPNVEGFRLEYAEGPLIADFSGVEDYEIDGSRLPTKTIMATAVSRQEVQLTVESILRSEEHTSELQSRGHLVCRLLLEKKKRYAS